MKIDKMQNFERLAEKRVTETIKKIRLVGNLANKGNYSYTDEHVRQILDAIEGEVKNLKAKFKDQEAGSEDAFAFKKKQ